MVPRVNKATALGAVVLAAAALGTGCYRNTYTTGLPQGGGTYVQKAPFFLWGLVGQKDVDMRRVCPNGVAWFQNRATFVDGLLNLVTFGIYSPLTIEVRCSSGQAYLLEPDEERGITWVTPLDAPATVRLAGLPDDIPEDSP